jgi:hypothetical protein
MKESAPPSIASRALPAGCQWVATWNTPIKTPSCAPWRVGNALNELDRTHQHGKSIEEFFVQNRLSCTSIHTIIVLF